LLKLKLSTVKDKKLVMVNQKKIGELYEKKFSRKVPRAIEKIFSI